MERKRSEYVFVAFWMAERSTREWEQGESYGKNSNEAHSPDLMKQKKYNHRGHVKVTPMYEPLFDLYSHHCICLSAIFNTAIYLADVFCFLSPKFPSVT